MKSESKTIIANIFIKFLELEKQSNSTPDTFCFKNNNSILTNLYTYTYSSAHYSVKISYNQQFETLKYLSWEYDIPIIPLLVFQQLLFCLPTRNQINKMSNEYIQKLDSVLFDRKVISIYNIEYKPDTPEYKTDVRLDDTINRGINAQIHEYYTYIQADILAFREYLIHKIVFFTGDSIDNINIMLNYLQQSTTSKIGYELIRQLEMKIHPNHYRELVDDTVEFCNKLNHYKIQISINYESKTILI